jgi:hypothetical protein
MVRITRSGAEGRYVVGASRRDMPGPGWYADPKGIYEERFWDGERSTDRVQGARQASTEQSTQERAAGAATSGQASDDVSARIAELASTKLDMRMGVGKELKKLPALLLDGEEVLNLARGRYDRRQGLVVLTDRRILFVEEGVMRSRLEDFPYAKVSSVQSQTAVMSGKLQIFASGNKAVIDNVLPKARAVEIADYVRHRIAEPASGLATQAAGSSPPVAAVPQPDVTDQLMKLGELRDAGVLTTEEFESKKAELLARL